MECALLELFKTTDTVPAVRPRCCATAFNVTAPLFRGRGAFLDFMPGEFPRQIQLKTLKTMRQSYRTFESSHKIDSTPSSERVALRRLLLSLWPIPPFAGSVLLRRLSSPLPTRVPSSQHQNRFPSPRASCYLSLMHLRATSHDNFLKNKTAPATTTLRSCTHASLALLAALTLTEKLLGQGIAQGTAPP